MGLIYIIQIWNNKQSTYAGLRVYLHFDNQQSLFSQWSVFNAISLHIDMDKRLKAVGTYFLIDNTPHTYRASIGNCIPITDLTGCVVNKKVYSY